MTAILAPVAVTAAATVDSTAAAEGAVAVAGGAAGVEKVCSDRKTAVIGRACTAAVEAVVEGAEVLPAAFCYPSTFMLLELSIRGVPRAQRVCAVCDPQANAVSPR